MRNEERNVETLTSALKAAVYPHLEFIILNDQSTDRTGVLLEQMTAGDSRFTVIGGKELPPDWVGKVHACHQLQKHAKGDYLLFIDADIRFSPEAIGQALALMNERQAKLLSGFPAFDVPPFLSKLLVPMQHFCGAVPFAACLSKLCKLSGSHCSQRHVDDVRAEEL
nr:glycosyltransferase [Planococcus glaciei]